MSRPSMVTFVCLAIALSGCMPAREEASQAAPASEEAAPAPTAETQPPAVPAQEAVAAPAAVPVPEPAVSEPAAVEAPAETPGAEAPATGQEPVPPGNREAWVVTASSQEQAFSAAKAIDGLRTTRWSSEFKDDQWWMVDFGNPYPLERVTVLWEDAYAATYKILLSLDGETWQEVHSEENGDGGTDTIDVEPQEARYVRIACGHRGTQWGFSIFEVLFNEIPRPMTGATASSGNGVYAAPSAVDGDWKTRWSSSFDDDEWWMIRFEEPQIVSGLLMVWETAFGEKYRILLSEDGDKWTEAYNVTDGDGATDILFFKPTEAQYLKLAGSQRGTGWGYSIWEMEFFTKDQVPRIATSSSREGGEPEKALDGDRATAWASAEDGQQDIRIDPPRALRVGGLELGWGANYAVDYAVDVSPDGENWTTVYETSKGNGGRDYIYFAEAETAHLRIQCRKSSAGKGYELANVEFKGGEEKATPIREYKDAAKEARHGRYPMWLLREQEFWTVVGVADDWHESLVGETGAIEPYKGGFCVLPFVFSDGKLTSWADVPQDQRLEDEMLPMPIVRWSPGPWELEMSFVAFGPVDQSVTAARYRFINNSDAPFQGRFALAVQPVQLNPVWQHGGMSPINEAECVRQGGTAFVKVNGEPKIVALTPPAAMGAVPLDEGDAGEYIARGEAPPAQKAGDGAGRTSVAVLYDLDVAPGATQDVVVAYLLHPSSKLSESLTQAPDAGFDRIWAEQRETWSGLLNRFSITIPDQRLIRMMKSNIAYILINKDGPWIKPGPRNYAHAWIRDGAMTSVALLRMGLYDPVKRYIEAYAPMVNPEGWTPFIVLEGGNPCGFNPDPNAGEGHEFDSQGEFVFLVRQYVDFTGDTTMLESVYPKVIAALRYGQKIREARLTPEYKNDPKLEAFYGILPLSNSHEGYYPAQHSYWDDFWMLRGLKDGAHLAGLLNRPDDVAWIEAEERGLRECLLASIRKVIERDGINYIPGCVEKGDFDPTSTAIAIMACGEGEYLPQPYLQNTFDQYFKEFATGMEPGKERTFTPYEVRTANAFVRMGQRERALTMLRYLTEKSVRPYGWNHLAEVVHARPRAASYIGDMPHTWVGSGYISAVRSLFAYEHDGRLIVAAGVDPAWLDAGVSVQDLPTQYGRLNYTMRREGEAVVLDVSGQAAPPKGFEVPLPRELAGMAVEINGQPAQAADGVVKFNALPATVRLSRSD